MSTCQPLNFAIKHIPQTFSYSLQKAKWQQTYSYTMDEFGISSRECCKYENDIINKVADTFKQHLHNYTTQKESISDIMLETSLLIKEFTKSSDAHLYVREGDIIYRYKKRGLCATYPTKWKIGSGTVVSAYVAETMNFIVIDRGLKSKLFPLGVGRKDSSPEVLLCMPIVTPEKYLLGVIELSRENGSPYTITDIDLVIAISGWMAASIAIKLPANSMYKERTDQFCMTQKLYNDSNDIDGFISDIMVFIRDTIHAREVNYYNIISEKKYIVQLFSETPESKNKLVRQLAQFTVPEENYLLRYVINTQCVVSVSREEEMFQFCQEKDVKSVIYYPVQIYSKLLGIIVLRNKLNGEAFTDADKNTLFKASVFCKAGLNYCFNELECSFTIFTLKKQIMGLQYHMAPCSHEINMLAGLTTDFTFNTSIILYNWNPEKTNYKYLVQCILQMFYALFQESSLNLQENTLKVFISMVRKAYRKNPYHNFMYAFTSLHCMFSILWSCGKGLTEAEKISMMIAVLCHNIDHHGNTNNFFKLTNHHVTSLYLELYNEHHNSFVTNLIINHSQMLSHLTVQIKTEILNEIENLILSTNLRFYFEARERLFQLLPNGFDWISLSHKKYLKTISMTVCVFSPLFKQFDIAYDNTMKMYEEFKNQANEEISLGLLPLVAMNPNNTDLIPQNQVALLISICIPCLDMLSTILPHTTEILHACRKVIDKWKIHAVLEL